MSRSVAAVQRKDLGDVKSSPLLEVGLLQTNRKNHSPSP